MEDNVQFEKALERLEKIVTALESGELSLDEALKRYEEGVQLSRTCAKKLNEAEKKIEMLTRSLNGMAGSGTDGDAPKSEKKKLRKAKPVAGDDDSDLLI